MSTFGTRMGYYSFRLVLATFSIIPFWFIYRISDGLYYILYYLVGYRKKLVRKNLERSFPEKSKTELLSIEKKFYRHLADIFMEGIKGLTMSDNQAVKRYNIITPDVPNHFYEKGEPCIFVGAHYNNWEWGALGTGLQVKPEVIVFYQPIKNKLIDDFVREARQHKGVMFCPISETSQIFKDKFEENPLYILLADQCPSNRKAAHWVHFLNQETPVLHGPAKYSQRHQLPIYFIDTQKVKRGFYEVSGELLIEDPSKHSPEEISEIFMKRLERSILEKPEFWLWSHNRWKYTKESVEKAKAQSLNN